MKRFAIASIQQFGIHAIIRALQTVGSVNEVPLLGFFTRLQELLTENGQSGQSKGGQAGYLMNDIAHGGARLLGATVLWDAVNAFLANPAVKTMLEQSARAGGLLLPLDTSGENPTAEAQKAAEVTLSQVSLGAEHAGRGFFANIGSGISIALAALHPTKGQETRRRAARRAIDVAA